MESETMRALKCGDRALVIRGVCAGQIGTVKKTWWRQGYRQGDWDMWVNICMSHPDALKGTDFYVSMRMDGATLDLNAAFEESCTVYGPNP